MTYFPVKFPRVDATDSSGWIIDPSYLGRVKREVARCNEPYDLCMEEVEQVLLALEKMHDN